MNATHVMVELEKMVSDGNYGRERAVVQFAVDLDEGEDVHAVTTALLRRARNHLAAQLSDSESVTVRRAINPPPRLCSSCQKPLTDQEDYDCTACDDARKERYRQQEQERRARWEAERALQPVSAGADDPDDDEDEPV